MLITKEFTFDSAHQLLNYKGKCENLHGHTYKLQVTLKGELNPSGMVIDFQELKEIVKEKILKHIDHTFLNDLLPQPTAENLAIWIWENLNLSNLYEIKLWENQESFVTYQGEE